MPEQLLAGCAPEPLGSYLKALGVLRLVGQGPDPGARGWWRDDGFVLSTELGPAELVSFLLCDWTPTPVVSPWNNGAGFSTGSTSPGAVSAVAAMEAAVGARFEPYRRTIAAARGVVEAVAGAAGDKEAVMERCRAELPDAALAWLDAAVVLAEEKPEYPPLLGSGGNLGRLELSVNFMQRIAQVLDLSGTQPCRPPEASEPWLRASLFRDGAVALVREAAGQYDPGRRGGVNSSSLVDAGSLVNPWDFVLTLEGALLFAGAAARRLGAGARGTATIPFTVAATPVGYPDSTIGEKARGEIWAPLWHRPATVSELAGLLGEGRAQWGRAQSRTGVDFARAAASLGVARGIDGFVRHAIVERFGQDMLAVAVDRVEVSQRPVVTVLSQLDPWLDRVRRASGSSAAVASGLRRVEAAQYAVAVHGGAGRLQEVLAELADLERAVARSASTRSRAEPVQRLNAEDWRAALAEGPGGPSPELRLATALASLTDRLVPGGGAGGAGRASALATLLRPVERDGRRLRWAPGGEMVPGLGWRDLVEVLAEAHQQRAMRVGAGPGRGARSGVGDAAGGDASTEGGEVGAAPAQGADSGAGDVAGEAASEGGRAAMSGADVAFSLAVPAALDDVAGLLDEQVDERSVARLLAGLLLLDWSGKGARSRLGDAGSPRHRGPALPAWAVLAPFFESGQARLRPQREWVPRLCAGQVAEVVRAGLRRLRMAELPVAIPEAHAEVMARGVDGRRLAAALLVPMTPGAYRALRGQVAPPERVAAGGGLAAEQHRQRQQERVEGE